jgi:hypothetical protein
MSPNKVESIDQWTDCPEGMLADLAGRQKRVKRVQKIARISLLPLGLLACLSIYSFVSRSGTDSANKADCPRVYSLLPTYIEEKLTPADLSFVQQHLAGCSKCRQALQQLKSSSSLASESSLPFRDDNPRWAESPDQMILRLVSKAHLSPTFGQRSVQVD